MEIQGPAHLHGPQAVNRPHRTDGPAAQPPTNAAEGADQLDISPEADLVSRVQDLPEVRTDRVAEIREQIEMGEYETEDKLDVAVGRMLDELAG